MNKTTFAAYANAGFIAESEPIQFVGNVQYLAGPTADSTLLLLTLSMPNRDFTFAADGSGYRARYQVSLQLRKGADVSQQIDAMRALGTDPVRKLVVPRMIALIFMLPLLTVAADVFGLIGGGIVANFLYNQEIQVFVESVRNGISTRDILGGIIKPFFFGLVIGAVACHKGLSTSGGTVGVGRSVTNSVVTASIWVIIFDFFLAKALQYFLDIGRI